jgi:membrane-associated phospholipid phosphatase
MQPLTGFGIMATKKASLLAILLMLCSVIAAQDTTHACLKLNGSYFISGINDAVAVAQAPAQWGGAEWLGAAAVAGGVVLLWTQDDQLRNFFQRNTSSAGHELSTWFFDPLPTYYLAAFTGGMYIYGVAAGNAETETAALLTARAVVITAAYATVFKGVFQRERPVDGNPADPDQWRGPLGGFRYGAFPSRHAAMSFAAAAVLGSYYKHRPWVAITGYTLATLVAFSQLHEDQHWASDALAGAALGFAIGKLVIKRHNKPAGKISLKPSVNQLSAGLALRVKL